MILYTNVFMNLEFKNNACGISPVVVCAKRAATVPAQPALGQLTVFMRRKYLVHIPAYM